MGGVRAYLNKPNLEESHIASNSIIVGVNGSELKVQVTLVFEGTDEGDEDGWEEEEEGEEVRASEGSHTTLGGM